MIINKRIPLSYIFSLTKGESISAIVLAGIISVTDEYYKEWFGIEFPLMPLSVPSMLGTVITLILAFKMAQSYDRWWEARKIWGAIVNDSRSLIREVSYLKANGVAKDVSEKLRDKVVRLHLAWLYEAVIALRGLKKGELTHNYLTTEDELELNEIDANRPNAILNKVQAEVSEAYEDGALNDYQQIQITETISRLNDNWGKSERIKNTVFPRLYSRIIDFAIWNFVVILPLAFRDPNKWVEFPVVLLLAIVFFTLENLALDLQDPFENKPTDIPILSITRNIEIFGLKSIKAKDIPEKIQPEGFYLM